MKREALPKLGARGNGWWRWMLLDSLGCSLTHATLPCTGLEKGKGQAAAVARAAALAFNAQFLPHVEPRRPRQQPSCIRMEN